MKKKAKKKAKRKTTKKTKKKKVKKVKRVIVPCYGLHQKKLEILRAVPIMPCSAISKDMQGLRYAHTQASKVYAVYRRECESRDLVIRRIKSETKDAHRPELFKTEQGWKIVEVPCVRCEAVWEICDAATGQTETFCGSGDGDNEIWSNNSAQTIAKKQALLDYFEVAWPQPTNWLKVVREAIAELEPQDQAEAIKAIIPEKLAKATGILDEIGAYFDKVYKKGRKKR